MLWLCAAALAATLAGCATDRLASVAPKKAPQLAGRWTLDAAHSEPISTAVTALEVQLRKRLQKLRHAHEQAATRRHPVRAGGDDHDRDERRPHGRRSSEPQEPSVSVNAPLPGSEFVRELVASVPAGTYLGLRFASGQVTVRSAQHTQDCTLGIPTSITLGEGSATETCGWRKKAFLIEFKPLVGPMLSERFTLDHSGELVMMLRISGGNINVRLVRRYRRTPHASPPVLLPTGD